MKNGELLVIQAFDSESRPSILTKKCEKSSWSQDYLPICLLLQNETGRNI